MLMILVHEYTGHAFSVPSKVLSYLCAGKPILAAIPRQNLAARIIAKADAGIQDPPFGPRCDVTLTFLPPAMRVEVPRQTHDAF